MCLMNQLFKNNQLAKDVFTEKYALPGETPEELFNRITNQFYNKELERFSNLDETFIQDIYDKMTHYEESTYRTPGAEKKSVVDDSPSLDFLYEAND